ncbi:metal ABC transporter solute-binding protein, Zn/Mn family [Paenibacillus sp.]|uniref:metal ABC transporter solute-binding protein, Zn/Mn family n=1 Tax=Paenibacillus sp. TaxID=58172 RepID=UPI002D4F4BB5|nr:zinc ABC transporter substrate-binding protein [Paenibacillus sp.]HZG57587.1 zinc ABC transporter substrate-binding protein [Paenibacillus sp.]
MDKLTRRRGGNGAFVRAAIAIGAAVVAMATAGCSGAAPTAGDGGHGKLRVTTTIGQITDLVENVGGEHVQVVGIMPPGVDPHLYKATQGDISKFEDADIIFYNGLHLEGKMTEVFEEMAERKPTIAVAETIEPASLIEVSDNGGKAYDPHIWFDVRLWMVAAETVKDELSRLDPENAAAYEANAAAYAAELEKLDAYVRETIAGIPKERRVLVTAHDAFGYFGKAYDIEVRGLQGISTASEAGSKDVTDLRDYLVAKKIKAIFVETSVSDRSITAVIEGARELGHDIAEGGTLYSDAMGEAGTPEGTYLGMVKYNVDTIANALK